MDTFIKIQTLKTIPVFLTEDEVYKPLCKYCTIVLMLTYNTQKVQKYFVLTLLIPFEMCTLPDDDQACSEQAGI